MPKRTPATMPRRTPAEIRTTIEANRVELQVSLARLRGEVAELTDWRRQIVMHRRNAMIGAAVAGLVVGNMLFPRRRRRGS
jgi:hypothetical protein